MVLRRLAAVVAIGASAWPAQAAAEKPETAGASKRKVVELSARLGMRLPECSLECAKLPPGLGLTGSIGLRLQDHVAVGFMLGHERFFYSEDDYPLRGYTKLGVFGRGYWLARGALDPFAEIGGLAAASVGECPNGGETGGGVGYRLATGLDVHMGPSLKLGFALAYERISMWCTYSSNGAVPLASGHARVRDPEPTAGGLGVEAALTALAY